MPELTQFDSTKSMMRNLPPNGVAGLQRCCGSALRPPPQPPPLPRAVAARRRPPLDRSPPPPRHDHRQGAARQSADITSGVTTSSVSHTLQPAILITCLHLF